MHNGLPPLTPSQAMTTAQSVSNVRDSARSVGGERASSSFATVPVPDMMRLSPKIRHGSSRPKMVSLCNPKPDFFQNPLCGEEAVDVREDAISYTCYHRTTSTQPLSTFLLSHPFTH